MCGISGIISLDGNPIKYLHERLDLMTKSLHHRGPDKSEFIVLKIGILV